jgi:hypothetical protein
MNYRTVIDDFTWAKGEYALSRDRTRIVRKPDIPPHSYDPGAHAVGALAFLLHIEPDADGALAFVQRFGFLTAAPTEAAETVGAILEARERLGFVYMAGLPSKESATEQISRFNATSRFEMRGVVERDEQGESTLVIRPAMLRDWLWFKAAGGVSGTTEPRRCANPHCTNTFEVDLTDGNSRRRRTCSDACRVALHYHEKQSSRKRRARK